MGVNFRYVKIVWLLQSRVHRDQRLRLWHLGGFGNDLLGFSPWLSSELGGVFGVVGDPVVDDDLVGLSGLSSADCGEGSVPLLNGE